MCKLISSGIYRYMHSLSFKLCVPLTVIAASLFSYRIRTWSQLNGYCFLAGTIIFAALISTVIGKEISMCIRNKISVGYTKTQIYFSELILANIFVVFLFVIFLVLSIVLNVRLFDHIPLKLALQTAVGFLCMALLFANVFAVLSCIIRSKTGSVLVCLVLIITLFSTSTLAGNLLDINEYVNWAEVKDGERVYYQEKNPDYIDEPLRSVLVFYRDVNPYGLRIVFNDILVPFLYDDEDLQKAKEATANTIGNDFLNREISEEEQKFLNVTPYWILVPVPFFVFAGWVVFRKKEFN